METVSLAVSVLLSRCNDAQTLESVALPLRWIVEHPVSDPISRVFVARAICLAAERMMKVIGRVPCDAGAGVSARVTLDGEPAVTRVLRGEGVQELADRPIPAGSHRLCLEGTGLGGWVCRVAVTGQARVGPGGPARSSVTLKGYWERDSIPTGLEVTNTGRPRSRGRSGHGSLGTDGAIRDLHRAPAEAGAFIRIVAEAACWSKKPRSVPLH